MTRETKVTGSAFYFGLLFYGTMQLNHEFFVSNIFEIATYSLIFFSALFVFTYVNNLRVFFSPLLGTIAFSTTYLGVLLAGTRGLSNTSISVIEGLSRIVLALCVIWHLSSIMRNLSLVIDPFTKSRSKISGFLYGILFPPKELIRLLKFFLYIAFSFYLVITGLNLLAGAEVNLAYLAQTEKVSLNILFFGIQTPMMMASRASVSRTFSEYLQNLDWAESAFYQNQGQLSESYLQILGGNEISYDSINSNGKHLWLSVLFVIILQAFEGQIAELDLFSYDWVGWISGIVRSVMEFVNKIF